MDAPARPPLGLGDGDTGGHYCGSTDCGHGADCHGGRHILYQRPDLAVSAARLESALVPLGVRTREWRRAYRRERPAPGIAAGQSCHRVRSHGHFPGMRGPCRLRTRPIPVSGKADRGAIDLPAPGLPARCAWNCLVGHGEQPRIRNRNVADRDRARHHHPSLRRA